MNAFLKIPLYAFNIFYPFKLHGKENIPKKGESAVLVCNHFRAIDCGFVADAYSKDIKFLAKKELFKNKLFSKVLNAFGAIPIDRDKPDIKSLLSAVNYLKQGHKLAIFPEGTRNVSGTTELQELKGGTAVFAIKAKCPIVPMMLSGKARCLRRTHLIIGKPFYLEEYYGKKLTDEDMAEIDKIIREKMCAEQAKLNDILTKKRRKKKKDADN